jgi:hypothetical protein
MSGFVVDSRTLVAVQDTLGRLHDQLVGMHTVIWQQWGTLGGQALESELEHFCGTWHYGVTELGGQLQDLTRRLGEAAAAYERIEQRITHASGGSSSTGGAPVGAAGSGHATAHHTATKHPSAHHTPAKHPVAKHPDAKHHSTPGAKNYSGGAPLAATGGGNHGGSDKHSGGDKHNKGDKHPGVGSGTTVIGGGPDHGGSGGHGGGSASHGGGAKHNANSGSGSGTTIIGGAGGNGGGSHGAGHHRPTKGSGSGTTVIGGGPTQSSGSQGGSGTTTIDEKIHRSEERQQAELNAVLKMVKD